ncbi:unnamed protein product, partial [Oikopleura dioica]
DLYFAVVVDVNDMGNCVYFQVLFGLHRERS